jgi:DNA-binding MarR family transcriptional regulator
MARSEELAHELVDFSVDLRRLLRNLFADDAAEDALTWAQSELLHDVRSHPGTTVNGAAERLHLAANTVSTLVRQLVDRGLLERRRNPDDGRSVLLYLAGDRDARRSRRADQRVARVQAALRRLDPAERALLADASPVLAKIVAELSEGD